jgi:putative ABC transport system permease protein
MSRVQRGLAVYRLLTRLLPSHFRERYAGAMEAAVAAALHEASAQGRLAVWLRLLRECGDLIATSIRQHFEAASGRGSRNEIMTMLRGLRHSTRALVRAPGFTVAAVLTLAGGIGCAGAAFAVLDAVLLRPLPHAAPDRLIMVWRRLPKLEMPRAPVSYPTFADLRAQSASVLSGLEAYSGGGAPALLLDGMEPERVNGARVTGGVFSLLGNRAALGRTIVPSDDDPAADDVVVLSHALWQRYFRADPAVLGRTIQVRERPHRVIGVMPEGFVFPSERAELWVPLRLTPFTAGARDLNFLVPVGRLRDGVMPERAEQQLQHVFGRLAQAYPESYRDASLAIEARHTYVVGDTRRLVLLGTAAAMLLLLIACANLGNLLLVRGIARARELAVRSALGATRLRILGNLLSESVVIALIGGALGAVIALGLTRLVVVLSPATLPRKTELVVNARVLLLLIAASFLVALVCALPAAGRRLQPARAGLATAGGSVTGSARRLQSGLVVAQVSLAFVLLVVAGLLVQTLVRVMAVPIGFDGSRVLTAHISLTGAKYDSAERIESIYDRLLADLATLPGVERVGGTFALPFSEDYASTGYVPADQRNVEPVTIATIPVRGDYFATVGMRLLKGRLFGPQDNLKSPGVVIINQTLAARFWPGKDAVGQRLAHGDETTLVVGVVNDIRRRNLTDDVEPELYMAHSQALWSSQDGMYVALRTRGAPLESSNALRAAVHNLDPLLPVARVMTLNEMVSRSADTERFRAGILSAVSAAALLLTLLGIYSVQSVFVSSYRRDLAVRVALGGTPGRVAGEVMRRGVRLAVIGILVGSVFAATATRGLRIMLFELSPLDPLTYAVAAFLFLSAAAVASYLPTRGVRRIDPMHTLRHD